MHPYSSIDTTAARKKMKVLYNWVKNIKFEYKLSKKEIQKVDEGYGFVVVFDDTFKADNHIFSIVSSVNGIISRMVRNFIARESNFV